MSATTKTGRVTASLSSTRPRLLGAAALSYVVATGVGVVMRLVLVGLDVGVPFDHLLHAHSHTLYFGWGALGVLIGAIDLVPEPGGRLTRTAWALALSVPLILGGFLLFGYNPITIAISTLVMFGWYLAIWVWWRETAGRDGLAFRFLRSAFGYLIAGSFGVWVLAYLQASGRGTPLLESLSVHAFLLGFAWFLVLAVIGLILSNARRLDLSLDPNSLRSALRWWTPLALLTFPLGVINGPEVAVLGPVARVAGLLLLYPAWLLVSTLWRAAGSVRTPHTWRAMAVWFAVIAVSTAFVAGFGSDVLVLAGRQGVVVYLHVLLVGFVTTGLFALMGTARSARGVIVAHTVALGLMLSGLVIAAAGRVTAGYWLALGGALLLWGGGVTWARMALTEAAR